LRSEQPFVAPNGKLIRNRIWKHHEENDTARFLRPARHSMPTYGAETAGRRAALMNEFKDAEPWESARVLRREVSHEVLSHERTCVTPTPHLRSDFVLLDGHAPGDRPILASSIRGAFMLKKRVTLLAEIVVKCGLRRRLLKARFHFLQGFPYTVFAEITLAAKESLDRVDIRFFPR